jgi:hypothetical protein
MMSCRPWLSSTGTWIVWRTCGRIGVLAVLGVLDEDGVVDLEEKLNEAEFAKPEAAPY